MHSFPLTLAREESSQIRNALIVLTLVSERDLGASYPEQKCRCASCGAPAFLASGLHPRRITLGQSQNCYLFGKQNGFVDRLRHLTAQSFSSHVVGAEVLPGVNPAQSRLLRRR